MYHVIYHDSITTHNISYIPYAMSHTRHHISYTMAYTISTIPPYIIYTIYPVRRLASLEDCMISRANARQRRGRAVCVVWYVWYMVYGV